MFVIWISKRLNKMNYETIKKDHEWTRIVFWSWIRFFARFSHTIKSATMRYPNMVRITHTHRTFTSLFKIRVKNIRTILKKVNLRKSAHTAFIVFDISCLRFQTAKFWSKMSELVPRFEQKLEDRAALGPRQLPTSGAIPVKNERGEIVMQRVKVNRYIAGQE